MGVSKIAPFACLGLLGWATLGCAHTATVPPAAARGGAVTITTTGGTTTTAGGTTTIVAPTTVIVAGGGVPDGYATAHDACTAALPEGSYDVFGAVCIDVSGGGHSTVDSFEPPNSTIGAGDGVRVCVVHTRVQGHVRVSLGGQRDTLSASVLLATGKIFADRIGAAQAAGQAAFNTAGGAAAGRAAITAGDTAAAAALPPSPAETEAAANTAQTIPELVGLSDRIAQARHVWTQADRDRVRATISTRIALLTMHPLLVDCTDFTARGEGQHADVTIRYDDASGTTTTVDAIELVVSRAYIGAARVGLGVIGDVGGDAIPTRWGLVQTPFASEREVRSLGDPTAAFEVVVGASAFVYDYLVDNHGRDYQRRSCHTAERGFSWARCAANFVPGIYAGVGVISTTFDSISSLASIHLGLEWELVQGFAVALTVAWRRGQHLQAWVREGTVLAGDSVPLESDDWRPAVGLLFNVSPDFLQIPGAGQ